MEPDDWNLIRDWQGGAQEAFTELVRRHLPLVLASARRQLPDPHLAEDVAQGYISLESARNDYGVAVDPATLAVNVEETRKLRG
mgnify:CR=1 FL=1